ncbi:LytTR family transcriptional regulator DNA-binding domain-containing protein [Sphingomonas aerophila]|uniref:HTH LytTR-type domain-containing protein n=1 Tax=Sphingomonas aerophila TaxID=1344948 RepID=A0A7W9BGI9_9SPHN|nr:hypothetical protein [Sphingomonas aerophila]
MALLAASGFVIVLLMVLVANAESTISDLRAAHASVPDHLVWSWEWSSIVGWLSLVPTFWWTTGKLRSPRFRWPVIAVAALLASVLASAWHIVVMVALRHIYYAATGEGPYRFFGVIGDRIAYEYRKDLVTFVQFVAIALVVRWMIDRQADAPASTPAASSTKAPRHLVVTDGPTRNSVPIHEVESVASAGNYVEIAWAGRTLLHRATLAGMEDELGEGFVRVHRGLIVRADAIRALEVERSGDFAIGLASGATMRGSRRYRDNLRRWSGETVV